MTSWPTVPLANSSSPDEAGTYRCLVEEVDAIHDDRWSITFVGDTGSRVAARARALEIARSYAPQKPLMEQSRRVFQLSPDGYIVQVFGALSDFHFRVNVVEELTVPRRR